MKRYKYTISMTLLLSVLTLGGIFIGGAGVSGTTALAQSPTVKVTQPPCSEKTIQGRYGFISSGSAALPTIPAEGKGPLTGVGTVSFSPQGEFTLVATRSVNGRIDPEPLALTGSYTVNDDCTLTLSFVVGFTFRAIIVDGGKEIRFIETDPGTTFIVVAKKI
jgi:hypothetical protein